MIGRGTIAAAVLLAGCVEFVGERGLLGFSSNLVVDGVESWTPEHGITDHAIAWFYASKRMDIEDDGLAKDPDVQGSAVGVQVLDGDTGLTLTGASERGRVLFSGEVEDVFRVAFREPTGAVLFDPVLRGAGVRQAAYPEAFGVVGELTVAPGLQDRRGRSLGYDPTVVSIRSDQASSWHDEDGFHIELTEGDDALSLETGHHELPLSLVAHVRPTEVVELELEVHRARDDEGDRYAILRVVGRTATGLPVYGLEIEWEADDGHALTNSVLFVEDARGVTASWGGMEVGT